MNCASRSSEEHISSLLAKRNAIFKLILTVGMHAHPVLANTPASFTHPEESLRYFHERELMYEQWILSSSSSILWRFGALSRSDEMWPREEISHSKTRKRKLNSLLNSVFFKNKSVANESQCCVTVTENYITYRMRGEFYR